MEEDLEKMQDNQTPKYVIFSGGIGGAKLIEGFYESVDPREIAVISNTGDDIIQFGLRICPDIDIVIYTLSNMVNKKHLWGLEGDTFSCLNMLKTFYGAGADWFHIGDKDFATHIYRTEMLKKGYKLSNVIQNIIDKLKVKCQIFPMAEEYIPTRLETDLGTLHFEEYFVKYQTRPKIRKIIYGGSNDVMIPEKIDSTLSQCEKIIIAPSNPFLSIQPILEIPFYKEILKKNKKKVIAVTPIIKGRAVKGPTISNMKSMGLEPTSWGVAKYYQEFISKYVFDESEVMADLDIIIEKYRKCGIEAFPYDTLMNSIKKKKMLATFIARL
ncbi:MAG: 2-phospho-L-lactate transferase [Candidatus Lokiarchaeota archaeon]|nr:2-phospho-L-lactate transferase [Candidatus Lokiarchaeota archaeon]